MKKYLFAAAIVAASLASTAQANITVYTSLSAFQAAVTAPGVDTFNDLSITSSTASPITRAAGAYGYTASAANATTGPSSFYGAGSGTDHWLSTNISGDVITFTGFTGGVQALGGFFFTSDVSGLYAANPDGVTLTATDASGTVTQVLLNPTTTSFLGFVSTGPLLSATLAANITGSAVWPTANNLILARGVTNAGVPEPASWAMMIAGFGLVGGALRRRQVTAAIA